MHTDDLDSALYNLLNTLETESRMATAAGKTGFLPVHDAHAIEQLHVTVLFERPLSDAEMRLAAESLSQFEDTLPGFSQILGMGFSVGPHGVNPIMSNVTEAPAGLLRTFTNPKGLVVRELKLERQALTYRTLEYTRWDAIWGEARGYFSGVLAAMPSDVRLSGYVLSYSDKFVWQGNPSEMRANLLLRAGSPHISPSTFDAEDLWHCHSGRFVKADESVKRLVVVDCDCVDESGVGPNRRVVRIGTTVTEMLNQQGYVPVEIPLPEAMGKLNQAFPELHTLLKNVFAEVVNDNAAEAVALNGAPNAA